MAKFKILFVDDAKVIRDHWGAALEAAGYEVQLCATQEEARRVIAEKPDSFDLAIIDLQLVEGDSSTGFAVAKSIKEKPVILLTGSMDIESVLNALNNDDRPVAVTAVHKTAGPKVLIEAVRRRIIHRVFVAHGHDEEVRTLVCLGLKALGVEPIVLGETTIKGKTIIESVEEYSNVSFAVVVLTPDDIGGVSKKELRPRPRQNVILEWGFFVGRLGRDHVTALYKVDKAAPLELPSNHSGLRYITIDPAGNWCHTLAKELEAAGIPVDAERVTA